jgi:hypothetical protein
LELANGCQRRRLSYVRLSLARKTVCAAGAAESASEADRQTDCSIRAHAAESFAFLPFAACVTLAPACLSRRCARRRSVRAFLAELVAARSMSVSALPSFLVTLFGIGWPAHVGLVSAASNIQRAVVHGSVVVVGGGGASVIVDVVGVLLVVVLATVASRRTSPPPSAT